MSEFKDVLTSSPNPLPSHSSLFSFQNSPKDAALRKKVWVIGGIAVVVTTIAGIVVSEFVPQEIVSDAICALTCGLSLTIIGCLLAATIVSGSWSVSHECYGSRNAGFGLGGAATVCVVLLVLGISGLSFGLTQLFTLL